MATALKLRSDIKKLKAALKSKATPKSFIPKLKGQIEKAEAELASLKNKPQRGRPAKKSTTEGTKKTLTALQKLIQKKKFRDYQGAGVDLKKDADEGAFAKGKRVSKGLKANQYGTAAENKGNTYYEYRANHYDVKQPKRTQSYPKLEHGGYMAKGGKAPSKSAKEKLANLAYQLQAADEGWIKNNHSKFVKMQNEYKEQWKKVYGNSNYANPDDYASGGYMANGGELHRIEE